MRGRKAGVGPQAFECVGRRAQRGLGSSVGVEILPPRIQSLSGGALGHGRTPSLCLWRELAGGVGDVIPQPQIQMRLDLVSASGLEVNAFRAGA